MRFFLNNIVACILLMNILLLAASTGYSADYGVRISIEFKGKANTLTAGKINLNLAGSTTLSQLRKLILQNIKENLGKGPSNFPTRSELNGENITIEDIEASVIKAPFITADGKRFNYDITPISAIGKNQLNISLRMILNFDMFEIKTISFALDNGYWKYFSHKKINLAEVTSSIKEQIKGIIGNLLSTEVELQTFEPRTFEVIFCGKSLSVLECNTAVPLDTIDRQMLNASGPEKGFWFIKLWDRRQQAPKNAEIIQDNDLENLVTKMVYHSKYDGQEPLLFATMNIKNGSPVAAVRYVLATELTKAFREYAPIDPIAPNEIELSLPAGVITDQQKLVFPRNNERKIDFQEVQKRITISWNNNNLQVPIEPVTTIKDIKEAVLATFDNKEGYTILLGQPLADLSDDTFVYSRPENNAAVTAELITLSYQFTVHLKLYNKMDFEKEITFILPIPINATFEDVRKDLATIVKKNRET